MATDSTKRGKGRPAKGIATRRMNIFVEQDLYDFVISQKGAMTVTDYVNWLIRKEVEAKKR